MSVQPGEQVTDRQILDAVAQTISENPRQWYWALMDYGSYLKQTVGNLNQVSKHYTKQSRLAGSRRQVRGQVLKMLSVQPATNTLLQAKIGDERLAAVLADLVREGLIRYNNNRYSL